MAGIDENEHLSLALARAMKLPAAHASVRDFGGERAIVVERFDRARVEGRVIRVHQEDLCQALGVMPEGKYESEGGPGIAQMVGILRETSSDADFDVSTLLDAVFLNWVIGGTDGHAKNYALLLAPHGHVRLAPLYDVINALPYFPPREVRMAVRVGGHYDMWNLRRKHWLELARELGLDPEDVVERCIRSSNRQPSQKQQGESEAKRRQRPGAGGEGEGTLGTAHGSYSGGGSPDVPTRVNVSVNGSGLVRHPLQRDGRDRPRQRVRPFGRTAECEGSRRR